MRERELRMREEKENKSHRLVKHFPYSLSLLKKGKNSIEIYRKDLNKTHRTI